MKKILFLLMFVVGNLVANAQSFSTQTSAHGDSVFATVNGVANINDFIINNTANPLTLKWHVLATPTFPSDWLVDTVFGICDDGTCRYNSSGQLWNGTSGTAFTASYPANATHDSLSDFHLVLNLSKATTFGTYYLQVLVADQGSSPAYTRVITFVINKAPSAVPVVSNQSNEVLLYPNPAHDELNVVYDPSADVKTIAVYNIIGKVMAVYKVSDPASANLNLENIPSGIYFVRLMNSHGEAVVTRRFTKQ